MNLSYEQFNFIFYLGLALAVLFLVISVVLFFVLKIPAVIGNLTGSTARKAISEIREGKSVPRKSSSNIDRSRTQITDKMTGTSDLRNHGNNENITGITTASLKSEKLSDKKPNYVGLSEETSVLAEETSVLSDNSDQGTVVTREIYTEQTTFLGDETSVLFNNVSEQALDFKIRAEIILFESNEVIA